jgi:hypothetical protein
MDFLVPEYEEDNSNDFEALEDELRTIVEVWLRQNNLPFEEK